MGDDKAIVVESVFPGNDIYWIISSPSLDWEGCEGKYHDGPAKI
jgi:hypothetical protein